MIKTLILATLLFTQVFALCPGDGAPCSGNGVCGQDDKCTCHRNWQGVDCASRTCAYSRAWDESKTSWTYKECGGKGLCDRKEGLCKCFEGFTGKGCRRMSCPEECSGHGTCETLSTTTSGAYTGWDAALIQKCVCDPAYEGVSCSDRKCKTGDDPLSLFNGSNLQVAEVQTITASSCETDDTFTIQYTDWRGETWTSRVLSSNAATAIQVEEALESLPNNAIPSVTVTRSGSAGSYAWSITFSDASNSGDQPMLVADESRCNDPGCQPIKEGSKSAAGSNDGTCLTVAQATLGTTENAVCSNRGICDTETGECACVSGYSGESCHIQTILA